MKLQIKKALVERNIRQIRKQLEELEGEPEPSFLQPVENPEETYVVRSREERRRKLLSQLERYEQALRDLEREEHEGSGKD